MLYFDKVPTGHFDLHLASWNFVLPKHEFNMKYTLDQDPIVAYIPDLPKNLVVEHIISCLLAACDPLVRRVSSDVSPMCNLRCLNHEWGWFISSTPNYAFVRVVEHCFRSFRGCRHRKWFDQKVFSKYNHILELFKKPIVYPPHTSLCL